MASMVLVLAEESAETAEPIVRKRRRVARANVPSLEFCVGIKPLFRLTR
jgi:hypothetical protein